MRREVFQARSFYWTLCLCLLFFTGFESISSASLMSPKSFSLKAPHPSKKFYKQISVVGSETRNNIDGEEFVEIEQHTEIFLGNSTTGTLHLGKLLERVLAGPKIHRSKNKEGRLMLSNGALVISLPRWPVGWSNYMLLCKVTTPVDKSKNPAKGRLQPLNIDLFSPEDEKRIPFPSSKREYLRVLIHMDQHSTKDSLIMRVEYTSSGFSQAHLDTIISIISSYLEAGIRSEISLVESRKRHLLLQYKEASNLVAKKNKKLELDTIINPDKYRKKSSTVRRGKAAYSTGDSPSRGGGGYRPSAAAQARRTVKSK